MISNRLVLVSMCVRKLKTFRLNINRSRTLQTRSTVTYGSSFFTFGFIARASRLDHKSRRGGGEEIWVRNLQYGPLPRLVRETDCNKIIWVVKYITSTVEGVLMLFECTACVPIVQRFRPSSTNGCQSLYKCHALLLLLCVKPCLCTYLCACTYS